jgi:hypothetical protein
MARQPLTCEAGTSCVPAPAAHHRRFPPSIKSAARAIAGQRTTVGHE